MKSKTPKRQFTAADIIRLEFMADSDKMFRANQGMLLKERRVTKFRQDAAGFKKWHEEKCGRSVYYVKECIALYNHAIKIGAMKKGGVK